MRFHPPALFILLLACLPSAVACYPRPELPPLAPVTGTVMLEGQPLPRGSVQFIPEADPGTAAPTATATINADGTYTLTTAGEPGAMIGWHRVRVVAQEEPRDETDTDPPSLIPPRYNQPETSPLRYEVQPVEMNAIDIELTK